MKNTLFGGTFILLMLSACNSESTQQPTTSDSKVDLERDLLGTWQATSFEVAINTYRETDTTIIKKVTEEVWEKELKVKPLKTIFSTGNTYRRVFLDLGGKEYESFRGRWFLHGDTLRMVEPEHTYLYEIAIKNGFLQLDGFIDWDGDGLDDDLYKSTHRLISKAIE